MTGDFEMNLDEIEALWAKDCRIDQLALASASADIPFLHAKYYKIFIRERILLRKITAEYKKTKLAKTEFLQNPNQEDIEQFGWKVPERGKILRSEVPAYLDGDEDLLELELKMGVQEEKVEFLKSIIDSITKRGFLIKNILDEKRFMNGG